MRRSISTHSPRAGRTPHTLRASRSAVYFNSLAPCGANPRNCTLTTKSSAFQLTRPVRGEPAVLPLYHSAPLFQLTRPVRGEPLPSTVSLCIGTISTHSPRAGRTCRRRPLDEALDHFNSLAPCGANQVLCVIQFQNGAFQLTRPVRGEPRIP